MKGGSIYLYESFSQVVKTSNVLMAEMAPTTVDQLLGQLIRREQAEWDSVAATADTRTHAGGGEAAAQHLTGVTHGQRPAVASALGNVVSAPPAHDGGQAKQRERNTSAGVTPGGQDGAQSQRKCSWKGCNYSCSTKGHLVRHMRVHTGEISQRTIFPKCTHRDSRSRQRKHAMPPLMLMIRVRIGCRRASISVLVARLQLRGHTVRSPHSTSEKASK